MPEQLKVHPGERVDLVDYVHGANEYTQEAQKFLMEREWLDRRSRILDGFRVRIEDQTANPGMITVFNGNAVDRDGQIINNEDTINDSRSITLLGANLNFYVEIEFILNESDTDARFFWDPTIPNTPPEPDGAEFSLNAATRLTPDWRLVSPVSTTSFEQTSNANSIRVPVGVFRTDGANRIVAGGSNPGLTLVRAASVLETDIVVGAATIRVVDARVFPATTPFNITLDFGGTNPEARTVSGIDRENGILSLSVATGFVHSAGAIVRVTSGNADLVRENIDPSNPTFDPLLATPGHPDPSQRLWQANEVRGSGLLVSKETFGARDDLNIRSLKDQIDYLSAQIRELKFGAPRPETVSTAPPATFATRPRWFDRAGSVTGARSNTVSIGNGTTTFGDFNGTDGSALLTAAIAALPAGGGTIYVKSGTYTFASTVSCGKSVVIIGDHYNSTTFNHTFAGGPAISATANMRFINLTIQRSGGASQTIDAAGAINFNFDYCVISGQIRLVNVNAGVQATNTTFQELTGAGVFFGTTVTATLTTSAFHNCNFIAVVVFACAINSVRVHRSNFTATVILNSLVGACNVSTLEVSDSTIACVSAVNMLNTCSGSVTGLAFMNNRMTVSGIGPGESPFWLANTGTIDRVHLLHNYLIVTTETTTLADPGFILYIESNSSSANLLVENNHFDVPTTSFFVGVNLDQDTLVGRCSISDNYFYRFMEMLRIGGTVGTIDTGKLTVSGNYHDNASEHATVTGISFPNNGRLDQLDILNNVFFDYSNTGVGDRIAINLSTTSTSIPGMNVEVRGNQIFDLDCRGAVSTFAYGVYFDVVAGATADHQFNICDNRIYRVTGENGSAGVYMHPSLGGNNVRVCRNRINQIGENGTTANAYGIFLAGFQAGGLAPTVMVSENIIYRIESSTAIDPASGIELFNCENAIIQGNYIGAVRSNAGANVLLAGCGIRVQGSINDGLNILHNRINQGLAAVASEAQCGIVINNESVLTGFNIQGNHIYSSTTSTHQITTVAGGGAEGYRSGNIADNIVIMRSTASGVSGIHISIGGNSHGVKIAGNIVEETTYDADCATHRGIVLEGNDVGAEPYTFSITGNMLIGPKSGALISSANRIGIWLRGSLSNTLVTSNMVDWNMAGVLEGIGIKYIDDFASGGPWHGHLCSGNYVRGDNSLAAGGEVDIDTATYQNGFLDSNQLGTNAGANGNIVPAGAAGNWTYGTNKLA
jgi:hypothetical protein